MLFSRLCKEEEEEEVRESLDYFIFSSLASERSHRITNIMPRALFCFHNALFD